MAGKAQMSDKQIREAVARAMLDESEVSGAAAAAGGKAAAAGGADPKKLFCDNWDTVKQVLQFLKPFLPKLLRGFVDAIIKAGDVLKGIICH
ncbi:MAG: hypothetical protein ACJ8ER_08645 [Allosphingosinicella sp.]